MWQVPICIYILYIYKYNTCSPEHNDSTQIVISVRARGKPPAEGRAPAPSASGAAPGTQRSSRTTRPTRPAARTARSTRRG